MCGRVRAGWCSASPASAPHRHGFRAGRNATLGCCMKSVLWSTACLLESTSVLLVVSMQAKLHLCRAHSRQVLAVQPAPAGRIAPLSLQFPRAHACSAPRAPTCLPVPSQKEARDSRDRQADARQRSQSGGYSGRGGRGPGYNSGRGFGGGRGEHPRCRRTCVHARSACPTLPELFAVHLGLLRLHV